MNFNGNRQLTMVFIAKPEIEAEGDHIWKSHAEWIKETHYREGDKALLQYTVSKGSDDEGNIHFVITEIYQTPEGHKDHKERAPEWKDFKNWKKWVDKCERSFNVGTVISSLW